MGPPSARCCLLGAPGWLLGVSEGFLGASWVLPGCPWDRYRHIYRYRNMQVQIHMQIQIQIQVQMQIQIEIQIPLNIQF